MQQRGGASDSEADSGDEARRHTAFKGVLKLHRKARERPEIVCREFKDHVKNQLGITDARQ
eukprot:2174262-Karenia_brevis.AAC.1